MFFIFFYEILIKKFNLFHNNETINKFYNADKIDIRLSSIPEEKIEIKIIDSNNKSNLEDKYKIVNIIETEYNLKKESNINNLDQDLKNYIISIV